MSEQGQLFQIVSYASAAPLLPPLSIEDAMSRMNRNEAKGLLSVYKDRLNRVKGFYHHFAAFATTLGASIPISFVAEGPVFFIPLFIWGPMVAYHANRVFGNLGKKSRQWEEEVLAELMHGDITELPDRFRRRAIASGTDPDVAQLEAARLRKRLENIEAIVTSRDWDALERETASTEAKMLAENVRRD